MHASTCPMLNTAASSGRAARVVKRIEGAELDETIADLNERGFPVKSCHCLSGRLSQHCALHADHEHCPRETTLGTSACECPCHRL